jgi:hypothetical protein
VPIAALARFAGDPDPEVQRAIAERVQAKTQKI